MLAIDIIYPIGILDSTSLVVVQPNKHDLNKLRICVDFHGLNMLILIDPFWTPLANEIVNEVARHECYSFINNFSGYNQVPIVEND